MQFMRIWARPLRRSRERVNAVHEYLGEAVEALTGAVLAMDVSAIRETKALLRSAVEASPAAQREQERAAQARLIRARFRSH